MANIVIRTSGDEIFGKEAIAGYLHDRGLLYRSWGIGRIKSSLRNSYTLRFGDRRALLKLYAGEIMELKAGQGYVTEDLEVLSDQIPCLDAILEKFSREHHHTDDEVRFVIDGGGVFTIRQDALIFDVAVEPGDLLVVPAYTRHWFNLTEERKIKCIRIFKDPAGWEAVYDLLGVVGGRNVNPRRAG